MVQEEKIFNDFSYLNICKRNLPYSGFSGHTYPPTLIMILTNLSALCPEASM
jgi:hypothetical protein